MSCLQISLGSNERLYDVTAGLANGLSISSTFSILPFLAPTTLDDTSGNFQWARCLQKFKKRGVTQPLNHSELVWVAREATSDAVSPCVTCASENSHRCLDSADETQHKEGLLRTGSDHGLAAGATPKAKRLCVWIIYCTNSHICISGHFQVTGALWFTSLCQTVLLLVRSRVDIKLVWMRAPSWIFKAAM